MLKAHIKPGVEYAFREYRSERTPFHRVRVIQHARGTKWRAQWIDPSPGLVDYVDSGQLVVPWKEHKAYLKEEASTESLRQHNQRIGYDENSPVARAVYHVFESMGDDISFYRGTITGSSEAVDTVKALSLTRWRELALSSATRVIRLDTRYFKCIIERQVKCACPINVERAQEIGTSADD